MNCSSESINTNRILKKSVWEKKKDHMNIYRVTHSWKNMKKYIKNEKEWLKILII